MSRFQLDEAAVHAVVERAAEQAGREAGEDLERRIETGVGLGPAEVAPLWFSRIETRRLYEVARRRHRGRAGVLETFSPLYMTNTCDAACRMCGMRRDNAALQRETAEPGEIEAQLELLLRRGMRGVALLTGEYASARREWAMGYVNRALRTTQALGFDHVLVNIGAVDDQEFEVLLDGLPRLVDGSLVQRLTMSTFQETYDPAVYAKFMGNDCSNPRANFVRRLENLDRAAEAGLRGANPGVLLGLNPDVAYEATALAYHVTHLVGRGMDVYVSVPRLRRVAGSGGPRAIGDADFVRLVAILSLTLSAAKIVITTREDSSMQQTLAPIVSVISAGSAAVAPYTDTGARFPLETSQFEVIDQRPFEAVLDDHRRRGWRILNFDPPPAAA